MFPCNCVLRKPRLENVIYNSLLFFSWDLHRACHVSGHLDDDDDNGKGNCTIFTISTRSEFSLPTCCFSSPTHTKFFYIDPSLTDFFFYLEKNFFFLPYPSPVKSSPSLTDPLKRHFSTATSKPLPYLVVQSQPSHVRSIGGEKGTPDRQTDRQDLHHIPLLSLPFPSATIRVSARQPAFPTLTLLSPPLALGQMPQSGIRWI